MSDIIDLELEDWEHLPIHDYCNMFPQMDDSDYDRLVQSIKDNGFMEDEPVICVREGDDGDFYVLDGRNRLNAALDVGIEPVFKEYIGEDALNFVVSRNLSRRHLTTGQKAALASKLANLGIGQNKKVVHAPVTQKEAAKQVGVGEASVRRYNQLEAKDPELADKVAKGEVPLQTAREKTGLGAKREQRKAEEEEKINLILAKIALDYELNQPNSEAGIRAAFEAGRNWK
ncbi:MAG: hypothetical protein DWQ49_09770 [Bacteroidetes bacterium]|nr:MAG: hypothetical protein DWQ49_09770 [Bacteroidota bacterium]